LDFVGGPRIDGQTLRIGRSDAKRATPLPAPWCVEEQAACFVVRDRSGQALAYVYFEDEPGPADQRANC
jgi:hypothetical protein